MTRIVKLCIIVTTILVISFLAQGAIMTWRAARLSRQLQRQATMASAIEEKAEAQSVLDAHGHMRKETLNTNRFLYLYREIMQHEYNTGMKVALSADCDIVYLERDIEVGSVYILIFAKDIEDKCNAAGRMVLSEYEKDECEKIQVAIPVVAPGNMCALSYGRCKRKKL